MSTQETTSSVTEEAVQPAASALVQPSAAADVLPLEEGPLQFRITVRKVRHEVQARGVLAE